MVLLCASQRDSSRSADREVTEQRITLMLIIVVVVFLVCQLPQAIQKLYTVYLISTPGALTTSRRLELTIGANICNLLVIINSAINFVLYSAFSAKFRQTFQRTFCCCRRSASVDTAVPLTTKLLTVNNDPRHRQTATTGFGDQHLAVRTSGHSRTLLDGAVNS